MTPPAALFPEFPLPWEMSVAEQFCLVGLLERHRPEVALEIGTHFGGSLQVLAAYSARVISIDLDPGVRTQLEARFPRAEFHTGPSSEKIPEVLGNLARDEARLGFVLIDGDHTARGVQADIEAVLQYRPRAPLQVLMHDSFNPDCRAGMRRVRWSECPFVHAVELDYVAGGFHLTPQGGAFARSLWGGFALAVLRPEPRSGPLEVTAAQEAMHRIMFRHSAHRIWHKVARRLRRLRPFPS
ncbi:MAG: class I SAM-dependent methyltransferase [Verrucomicrobia bacterium]|nr:class I SAM-dependent methyltransferase [Verrucomicrobiota bacterium]